MKNPGVNLDWANGGDLQLSLPRAPEDAEDTIAATTSGTASFACRISYLVDLLKALESDRVTLDHSGEGLPIRIGAVGDDNILAILMPTRW